MDAIVNDESYFSSKAVIKDITFASQESMVVKAEGSDNWPITWADDNNLYTAFGDGWEFEPKIVIVKKAVKKYLRLVILRKICRFFAY